MILHFSLSVAPRISLQNKYYADREQAVSLHCQVEGNPPPKITWTPCDHQKHACDNSFLNISKVQMSVEYTCEAENSLNKTSAATNLSKLAQTMLTSTCNYYVYARTGQSIMKWSFLMGSLNSLN